MTRVLKEIAKAFSIGIAVFIVLLAIQYFIVGSKISWGKELLILFAYNQLYTLVYFLSISYFIRYMATYYRSQFFSIKNLAVIFLGVILITIIATFSLHFFTQVVINDSTVDLFLKNEHPKAYYIPLNISIIVTAAFLYFYYYKLQQEQKITEQQLIAGTASAKFTALKNQLDPHFLFNSLNVLTGLIEENPPAAVQFTTALSKVYRYVLEQKDKELVTIAQELDFAKRYLSLLKMRYEDSLEVQLPDTIKNPEAKVVPLSLQLLIENAVKHNSATPTNKLFIKIEETENHLVITNSLNSKQTLKKGTGLGLQNIIQRFRLLSNRPVKVVKSDTYFTVYLPLLTKKIAVMNTSKEYISSKKLAQAKARVEAIKSFYIHLAVYIIVMGFLLILNLINGGFPWVIFPLVGWGFGVLGHASEAFDYHPLFGKKWEEKKINQYLNKK
jgi:sensor histidine kinase YesM